jgi:gliding motility-associated-like protein
LELAREMVGEVQITARVGSINFQNEVTVVFIEVEKSMLVAVKDVAKPDEIDQNIVRAIVRDDDGNLVANQSVTFNIISGTGEFVGTQTLITDANGEADIAIISDVEGSVTIGAIVNTPTPTPIENTVTVVFEKEKSRLIVDKDQAVANDVDVTTVRAIVVDANGNRLENATVKFTITDGTAVFVGSDELITDATGTVVINLQSPVAGVVHITATANGVPIIVNSPAEVRFVPGPVDRIELIIDANNADADGIAQNVVRVHVSDANGNAIPNEDVVFSFAGIAVAGGALTLETDENGNAVLPLTSTTVGDVTVTATVNGVPVVIGSPAIVSFTNYPDQMQLFVVDNNALANNTATNSVRAHIVDNLGNPMAGAVVVFTIASGDATIITPQPVTTDANGDAIIYLTSGTVGDVTITATADGRPIVTGSPAPLKFTEENIWVPRVFTPNGDGTNDVVRPIRNGIFNMQYFNIYNRWGNLLFTTNDINAGWDGRFKGAMQPNETYLWIIVGTNANNERVQKRGMLTLVR